MDTVQHQFLKFILAESGYICIWATKGGIPKQLFYSEIDEAAKAIIQLDSEGYDTYYACAKYATNENRSVSNAKYFKSFWIDIDCGEQKARQNKGYITQEEAINALKLFCKDHKLPRPTIVNSGNGVHCYWVMDMEMSYNEWSPVAETLKGLCQTNNFLIDSAVTANPNRILRVPGTRNYKDKTNPKKVDLWNASTPLKLDEFKVLIKHTEGNFLGTVKRELDATTKALMGTERKFKFSTIMKASLKDKGCAQLKFCVTKPNEVSYDLWCRALSIAVHCEDGKTAIHKISSGCESYDPVETDRKAQEWDHYSSCEAFKRTNPELCENCALYGVISSPILLGKYIPAATPEDNIITVQHKGLGKVITTIIPPYPYPYFRGKNGGICKKKPLSVDGDEESDEPIYANDLYVDKRLRDPEFGETIVLKHYLPKDGLEEFTVPLCDIMSAEKAKSVLSHHGVAVSPKQIGAIVDYVVKCTQELQNQSAAEIARSQFGWHDDNETFVVGIRQITRNGITYSPPSSATIEVAPSYGYAGSLKTWTKIANLYGKPGNEARAFILGLGFGAPLIKFSGISGVIVHIMNPNSGQGKTTVQYMVNSIWGHPKTPTLTFDDKPLARQHRMGILQNIPCTIDEVTNLTPDEASTLTFMATNGRGRERMKASSNSIRKNDTTWQVPCITSGNNSLHELLYRLKSWPEGELMRVLEIYMPQDNSMTKEQADFIYGREIFDNYGLACEPLMQYILNNFDECKQLFYDIRVDFDARTDMESKYRFYSSTVAASLAGLEVAKRAGLHNINIESIRDWAVDLIKKGAVTQESNTQEASACLGEFVNKHINNILVVNKAETDNKLENTVYTEPRGELLIRYERDTRYLYIAHSPFRKWCTENQISFGRTCKDMEKEGILLGTINYPLAKGLPLCFPPVKVLKFKYTVYSLD